MKNVVTQNGVMKYLYQETFVVEYTQATNSVMLNNGGWKTATTKRRMNEFAKAMGLKYHVYQKNNTWYATFTYQGHETTVNFDTSIVFHVDTL